MYDFITFFEKFNSMNAYYFTFCVLFVGEIQF